MNYKSIIWYGIGSYLTTMIAGMVYALSTGIDMSTSTPMSDELRYVSVFISLAVTLVWCCVYFLRRKSLASLKHGIVFGIGITILSFFLDFVMWLPFVSQTGSYEQLFVYYADGRFWTTIVLIILGCGAVGKCVQYMNQPHM